MSRRATLPGADELFRRTSDDPRARPSSRARRRPGGAAVAARAAGPRCRRPTESSEEPDVARRARAPRAGAVRGPATGAHGPRAPRGEDHRLRLARGARRHRAGEARPAGPARPCRRPRPDRARGHRRGHRRPRGQGRGEHPGPPAARRLTSADGTARRHRCRSAWLNEGFVGIAVLIASTIAWTAGAAGQGVPARRGG